MMFLIMVYLSVSMMVANETNEENIMDGVAAQITAIAHEKYDKFVTKQRKKLTHGKEVMSFEDFEKEIIRINGGALPVTHEAKKIVTLLMNTFFYEYEACDFFESYSQNNELHPTLKEKTLELLSTKYENLYVQEEFVGSFSSQRLALASDQLRKEYNERIG